MASEEDVSASAPGLYSLLDDHASNEDFRDDMNDGVITFSEAPRFEAQLHSHISNDYPLRPLFGASRTTDIGHVIAESAFADGGEPLGDLSFYYSDVGNAMIANITESTAIFGALSASIVTLEEPANQNLPEIEGA
jgi:hypothetical protein